MTNKNGRKRAGGGSGLTSLLLLIFIILKLTHVIDWSWLWVLSPLWIAASLGVLFFLIIGSILLTAVIGLANSSSRTIVEVKGWFRKKDQEESKID